jgi:phosphate:Na+ symporter
MELTELMVNNKLSLSMEARRDLHNYYDLVDHQFKAVIKALETKDRESVAEVLSLEEQINKDYDVMSKNHVDRLENGTCTVQTGVVFLDVIANLEKIADHLTNIAERAELNCSDQ